MKRLTDAQLKRLAEDNSASSLVFIWQEAQRARHSEAELLDLLELAVLWVEAEGYNGKAEGMEAPGWLELARDAIAKAGGK